MTNEMQMQQKFVAGSRSRSLWSLWLAVASIVLAASQMSAQIISVPITGTAAGGSAATTAGAYCSGSSGPVALNAFGDGCPASQISIASVAASSNAGSVWTDGYGNVYFADFTDFEIRVLYRGGSALASIIAVNNPSLVGSPQPGSVYDVAGPGNGSLVSPFYCNKGSSGTKGYDVLGDGCPAYQAYSRPFSGAVDADGDIFYLDYSQSARMQVQVVYAGGAKAATLIAAETGITTPLVGYVYRIGGGATGAKGYSGDGGLASAAAFTLSEGIALDSAGNIYIADTGTNTVRKIDGTTGIVTAFAGGAATGCATGTSGSCPATYTGDNGVATAATLTAYDVALDASGNVYIADFANKVVRAVYQAGTLLGITDPKVGYIYTVAGGGASTTSGASALALKLTGPKGVSLDPAGNLYIADTSGARIWKIDHQTGTATIFAGTGSTTQTAGSCSGSSGPVAANTIGDGCPATQSSLNGPIRHVAFDPDGVAYVSDSLSFRVRSFNFNRRLADTAVGSSTSAYVAVTSPASFAAPSISLSQQGAATAEFTGTPVTCTPGTTYAANTVCSYTLTFSPSIPGRRVAGEQFIITGSPALAYGIDGLGLGPLLAVWPNTVTTATSTITQPTSVIPDSQGNLYVSDAAQGVVWKGKAGGTFSQVITGLSHPGQLAVDGLGNLFVADTGNNRIVELSASGSTSTLISTVAAPAGVVSNGAGVLFISDSGNKRVLRYDQGALTQLPVSGLGVPGALALDSNGNLYIADTSAGKIATYGFQQPVSLSTAVQPVGLAVDAAGDLYIADANSQSILQLANGTTNPVSLSGGLSAAAGIGVDAAGNLFYTDSSKGLVNEISQNTASVSFDKTNMGEQSAVATLTLWNIGNAALGFTAPATYAASGDTADFAIVQGTPACTPGPLAAASSCVLNAQFTPVGVGSYKESLTFPSNAAGTATATLAGVGVNLVKTSLTLTQTSPASGSISYLQNTTFTATITPATSGATLTGTLIIRVDGAVDQTITLSGASAQFNLTFAPGPHVISATYSGDAIYASSFNTLSLTVSQQATVTTLAYSANLQVSSPTMQFTAHVSGAITGTPTGSVTFYNGTTALQTMALSAQGTATYSTATVVYPAYGFKAVYSGDTNYTTSTSTTLTLTPDFSAVPSATTFNAVAGVAATGTLTLTPYFNYSGTLSMSCKGMPQNAVCRFTPQTVSLSPGTAQTVTVGFYTNVSSQVVAALEKGGRGTQLAFLLFPLAGLAMAGRRFRARVGRLRGACLVLLSLVGLLGISGCTTRGFAPGQTPGGSSTVIVTITDGAGISHSISYTLNVTVNQ